MMGQKSNPRRLPKIVSREDVAKLLSVPNHKCRTGLRNRCIMQTLYRGGLRINECLSLSPEDIDFATGAVYVQEGKGKRDRYTYLDDDTLTWLKKWSEVRPESEFFFCTLKGGKIDSGYWRKTINRYSEKAGVYIRDRKELRPVWSHSLRHTFATELLEEGFSLVECQKLLGHADITTTSIYCHVIDENLKAKMRARA